MKNTISLKTQYEFKKLLYKGKYSSSSHLVIYINKNNIEDKNALGICVSKKNGNSVERNKIKRWTRESYTKLETFIKKGYNIIILYKKSSNIQNMNFTITKEEIQYNFKKLNMLKEKNSK